MITSIEFIDAFKTVHVIRFHPLKLILRKIRYRLMEYRTQKTITAYKM